MAESGEYEQRITNLIADSPENALKGLKLQHEEYRRANPDHAKYNGYDVEWGPLRDTTWKSGDTVYREFEVTATYIGSSSVYTISECDYYSE